MSPLKSHQLFWQVPDLSDCQIFIAVSKSSFPNAQIVLCLMLWLPTATNQESALTPLSKKEGKQGL